MTMSKLKQFLPILLIIIYIIISSIKLTYPGFQYDELLFGSAALGGFDGSFIHKEIYHFPLMLMPYIGALKSYFYFFIFLIFNPSYISIRLPMILLTAVSLWLIYKYVSKGGNSSIAILSILFLVADANFISLVRTDVGPVVIGLFFRTLAFLYFFKFIESHLSRHLIIISVSLLLGFYDKFNFVWFIVAFFIASIIFYQTIFGNVIQHLKTRNAKIIIGVLLLLFGFLIFLVSQLGLADELSLIPTQDHIKIVFTGSLWLVDGSLFYEYLIGDWNHSHLLGWFLWIVIIIGTFLTLKQPKSKEKTFHFFNLTILVLILIQILLTNKANAPWHIFMLYPMTSILLSSSLITICNSIGKQNKTFQKLFLTVLVLIIFCAQILTYSVYVSNYEKPYRNLMWSKRFDDLYAFSQSVPNRFVSIDWGFHNQFLTLYGKSGKYYEYAFPLESSTLPDITTKPAVDYFSPENNYLFVLHGENATGLKLARPHFFEIVEKLQLQAELVKSFDENGDVLYEVYQLKRKY